MGTQKSWVPSNLFTVTTSYETLSKPLYCVSLCSDLCKLKSTPCLLTWENCFGYRGLNDACCLGNFKVCHSRKPSGWICWDGGSRLDFSELSGLFILLFLLGILQCSWEVAGWFWGAYRKQKLACAPLPLLLLCREHHYGLAHIPLGFIKSVYL